VIVVAILAWPLLSLAQEPADPLGTLVRTLAKIENPTAQASILRGMQATLKGRTGLQEPAGWTELFAKLKESPNAEVRDLAQALGGIFGTGAVLDEMRRALADAAAPMASRRTALETLGGKKDAASLPAMIDLLKQPGELRAAALRTLAGYDDPRIAPAILASFPTLGSAEKRDAFNTLISRAPSARALLAAIDSGAVPRAEITAPLARQLQNLHDAGIDAWLAKSWGAVKATSADKQAQIAKYKEFLDPGLIGRADVYRGRAIFAQVCAACHELHGTGGKIGPHLTGGYEDIDYLLQNILDPNAVIGKDYQQTFVTLKDGQVLSGIVAGEDAGTLTLKTLGDTVTVQRAQIAEQKLSEQSMMPEGLLAALDEPSVRDLFLYLRQKQQTLMLATAMNANDFFNGADLARWQLSSPMAWKVEAGEIAGRSAGPRPVHVRSELVAEAFRFTAKVKVLGEKAAAEIVLRGRALPVGFVGSSLSLGGATPANVWLYAGREAKPETRGVFAVNTAEWVDVEVVATSEKTELKLNGKTVESLRPGESRRTAIAFYVANGELRVKEPKLVWSGGL
jgi:putative heme-binding domain-containing protein